TSANASEMKLICDVSEAPYWAPGASTSRLATALSADPETPDLARPGISADPEAADCAAPSISEKLTPNFASTMTVMSAAPPISSAALMICTQVVPFIPPTSTYTITSRPTRALTTAW